MREHRLNYNQGAQTIRTVAVSDLGFAVIPSAATAEIVDLRYSDTGEGYTVQAAAAATVDSVNTVTTAACGRGSTSPSLITLNSVTSIAAGRSYLLTNASGQSEILVVTSVDTVAKTVRAQTEPKHAYPSGATFKGLEVSASVSGDVCNEDDYFSALLAVVWTFTGVTPARVIERLELVRPSPSWASVAELVALDPLLAQRAGPSTDLETYLAVAHRDFADDLRMSGLDPYRHNPGPLGRSAVVYRAAYHALKASTDDAARERATAYLERYKEIRHSLSVGRDKPGVTEIDAPTGQAVKPDIRSLFGGL